MSTPGAPLDPAAAALHKTWAASSQLSWPAVCDNVTASFPLVNASGAVLAVDRKLLSLEVDEDRGAAGSALELAASKQRLWALERASSASSDSTMTLTGAEAAEVISTMHSELQRSWAQGKFVRALRLAIRAAKLARHPTAVAAAYPAFFVGVAKLLDAFGTLVFQRIKAIAEDALRAAEAAARRAANARAVPRVTLPDSFTAHEVPDEAAEVAQNWLYKIVCIRELVPRILVEAAIIRVYRFVGDVDASAVVQRLVRSVRGVGDPLVAAYLRWYLAHTLHELVRFRPDQELAAVQLMWSDFCATWPAVADPERQSLLVSAGVPAPLLQRLWRPPAQWVAAQMIAAAKAMDAGGAVSTAGQRSSAPVLELAPGVKAPAPTCQSAFQTAMREYRESSDGGAAELIVALLAATPAQLWLPALDALHGIVTRAAWRAAGPLPAELDGPLPLTALASYTHAYTTLLRELSDVDAAPLDPEAALILLESCWPPISRLCREEAANEGAAAGMAMQDQLLLYLRAAEAAAQFVAARLSPRIARPLATDIAQHLLLAKRAQSSSGTVTPVAGEPATPAEMSVPTALPLAAGNCLAAVLCSLAKLQAVHDDRTAGDAADGRLGHAEEEEEDTLLSSAAVDKLWAALPRSRRRPCAQSILDQYLSGGRLVRDRVTAHALLSVAKHVVVGLDREPSADVRRSALQATSAFVRALRFGTMLEPSVHLLTDVRAALPPWPEVTTELVYAGAKAIMAARGSAATSAATVKVALAWVHCTIPVHKQRDARVRLFALGAQVALAHGALGQADASIRAAVQEIAGADFAVDSADLLEIAARVLLGTLLTMPAHPDAGGVVLLRGWLSGVAAAKWPAVQGTQLRPHLARLRLAGLQALAAAGQAEWPSLHTVPGVSTTADLYIGDSQYAGALTQLMQALAAELYGDVQAASEAAQPGQPEAAQMAGEQVLLQVVLPLVSTLITALDLNAVPELGKKPGFVPVSAASTLTPTARGFRKVLAAALAALASSGHEAVASASSKLRKWLRAAARGAPGIAAHKELTDVLGDLSLSTPVLTTVFQATAANEASLAARMSVEMRAANAAAAVDVLLQAAKA